MNEYRIFPAVITRLEDRDFRRSLNKTIWLLGADYRIASDTVKYNRFI